MEQEQLNSKGDKRGVNSPFKNPANRGKDKAKLNKVQKDRLTDMVIDWMVEGYSNTKIVELVQKHSPVELSKSNAQNVLYYSRDVLEEITKEEVGTMILLHIGYCEQWYHYFHSIENIPGMNRAMKHKEDLLKLGIKHTFNVDQKKTTIIEKEVRYNVGKLTPVKQNRLEELNKKVYSK